MMPAQVQQKLRKARQFLLASNFAQALPLLNATNVNFLSFERLAKHYADLMDIWLAVREWDGFDWLETRYEDIVAHLEREGRRVTEFLALSWHDDQARFYEKSRTKQFYSPTYQDVTRPVYTCAVGRWRAYEKHLAPILPALEPYCRKFGYGCRRRLHQEPTGLLLSPYCGNCLPPQPGSCAAYRRRGEVCRASRRARVGILNRSGDFNRGIRRLREREREGASDRLIRCN